MIAIARMHEYLLRTMQQHSQPKCSDMNGRSGEQGLHTVMLGQRLLLGAPACCIDWQAAQGSLSEAREPAVCELLPLKDKAHLMCGS